MRILERDVDVYRLICSLTTHKMDHTQVNLIQLYIFELELEFDFAEYIQYTDVRIADPEVGKNQLGASSSSATL